MTWDKGSFSMPGGSPPPRPTMRGASGKQAFATRPGMARTGSRQGGVRGAWVIRGGGADGSKTLAVGSSERMEKAPSAGKTPRR
jgi:hypothetical protein